MGLKLDILRFPKFQGRDFTAWEGLMQHLSFMFFVFCGCELRVLDLRFRVQGAGFRV